MLPCPVVIVVNLCVVFILISVIVCMCVCVCVYWKGSCAPASSLEDQATSLLLASLSKPDLDGPTSSHSAAGITCEFSDVNNLVTRGGKKKKGRTAGWVGKYHLRGHYHFTFMKSPVSTSLPRAVVSDWCPSPHPLARRQACSITPTVITKNSLPNNWQELRRSGRRASIGFI